MLRHVGNVMAGREGAPSFGGRNENIWLGTLRPRGQATRASHLRADGNPFLPCSRRALAALVFGSFGPFARSQTCLLTGAVLFP